VAEEWWKNDDGKKRKVQSMYNCGGRDFGGRTHDYYYCSENACAGTTQVCMSVPEGRRE
jgi:hypothetical protein